EPDGRAAKGLPAQLLPGTRRDRLIREDDLLEDVGDEVALCLGLRHLDAAAAPRGSEVERATHAIDDAVDGTALLGAAREVDAAQDRRLLERVRLHERAHEGAQVRLEGGELERELADALPGLGLACGADATERARMETRDDPVELFVEGL